MTQAEERSLRAYPIREDFYRKDGILRSEPLDLNLEKRGFYRQGYEQAEKDTIERVIDWLEEHFMDNSHHSGRGDFGRIDTFDFDSMEDMFNNLKKTMEDKQ